MGVNVMRPVFNREPKFRVTMLAREEWTRGPGTPRVVKRAHLVYRWVQDSEAYRGWGLWAMSRKKVQYLSRKTCCSLLG
jgi:hypothetical protein